MTEPQIRTYGSWKSPLTAEEVFARAIGLSAIGLDGDDVYWRESLPDGRNVAVRLRPDGSRTTCTPPGYNVRTRVHEYGGGAYLAADGVIYFSNFDDQKLYRQAPGAEPQALSQTEGIRYADAAYDRRRHRLILVREDHTASTPQPVNSLVAVDALTGGDGQVLESGHDFYSTPRLSPDGTRLAWLAWDHPNMPWDGTELWEAEVLPDGSLGQRRLVAGGQAESIFQPSWSPDGRLYWVSDQTGWWNLYRRRESDGAAEPLCPMEAEFGEPQWVFGQSRYAFATAEQLVCTYIQSGLYHLAVLDTRSLRLEPIDLPHTFVGSLQAAPGKAYFVGGTPTTPLEVVRLDLATHAVESLRRSREVTLDAGYISVAQPIEFPTEGGLTAHAFFYPPQNRDFSGPGGERPPLLVMSHGGPTSATYAELEYGLQYWTSRGFAVLDVNYGGSTGYGRAYRERLKGSWGIVDVADCVNAARYLVAEGLADPNRLAIRGGSAGGFATLCALTFYDTFKAGASYFGVSDLEALARDTHKFESRYLDGMVGPYPERRDLYLARSPIHHTRQLATPIILLQGLDDPVVPPNQAEMMLEAVRAREVPVAYVAFPGEQHGFVKAENNRRAREAELYFYSRIFNFEMAEPVEPVPIENL
jgi:dipeptidyl aminopeptidase/acylaminoacyl peptidase